ncbi:MAG: repair protein RecN [Firmicutes bacterium]|nr:repair protein RecN [Bacillota bacterium]
MLKSLHVINFALIEEAQIDFVAGLNILTGETGAGKSILIDAFNSVLGGRSSVDTIRSGCDYFRVEAVFDIPSSNPVTCLLEEQGIPLEDDSQLILSRRLSIHGKNIILANGCNVPLSTLRKIGAFLVDMHGQHENQALLHPEFYLTLVDSHSPAIKPILASYQGLYQEWQEVKKQLAATEDNARERAQRLDMLTWQTQEIAMANLRIGEEEMLKQEISFLTNAEKITHSIQRIHALFFEGRPDNNGVIADLADIRRELESIVRFDDHLQAQLTAIGDAYYQLEETSANLRDYAETTDFDPERLSQLQERMDIIYKLKKKYGSSEEEILEYYRLALKELTDISNHEERMEKILNTKNVLEARLAAKADELHRARCQTAEDMAKSVCSHLTDMSMPNAILAAKVIPTNGFSPTGSDELALLFSANPGEEPKPLQKIASGGELSRIALAIKSVSAKRDDVGTMVFDEIDTGIGGQTALKVGEKIGKLGCEKQVLCITHLPHIACMADSHIYIEKTIDGERTQTIVRTLDHQSRLTELARMMGGDGSNQLAVDNAEQLLIAAQAKKECWKSEAQDCACTNGG